MLNTLLCIVWMLVSLFLVLIILLQRGKGGGLAGALGGVGGSSAFGTKAGDVFTKITVGAFGFWLLLAMILVWSMKTAPKFVEANPKEKGKAGAKATDKAGAATDKEADKSKTEEQTKMLAEALEGLGGDAKRDATKKDEGASPPPPKSDDKAVPNKTEPVKPPLKTESPKSEPPKTDAKKPAPKDDKAAPAKDGGKKP